MLTYDKTNFIQTLFVNFKDIIDFHTILFTFSVLIFNYIFIILNDQVSSFDLLKQSNGISITMGVFNFFLATTLGFRINNAYNSWKSGYSNITKLIMIFKKMLTILVANNKNNDDMLIQFSSLTHKYLGHVFYLLTGSNGRIDLEHNRKQFLNNGDVQNIIQVQKKLISCNKNDILEHHLHSTVTLTQQEIILRLFIHDFVKANGMGDLDEMGLNGCVHDILNTSQDLFNIANIPVVQIYNQFINICIVTYMILFSLNMTINAGYYSAIWTTLWSLILFIANNVCNQIDTPFGYDKNDIELEIILNNINSEFIFILSTNMSSNSKPHVHYSNDNDNYQTFEQRNSVSSNPRPSIFESRQSISPVQNYTKMSDTPK
jgi:predicted membrane chloride channel (bestrophin family)